MSTTDKMKDAVRVAATRAGAPVWRRLRPRIETIAARAAELQGDRAVEHAERLTEPLRRELSTLTSDLDVLRRDLDGVRRDLDGLHGRTNDLEHHTRLVAEQVAAIETRLGTLEADRRLPVSGAGDGGDSGEAAALLDAVRSEHSRVRVRMAAVASYEERIHRLENALADMRGTGR